jgi:predicted N-acetyltransferase YhbS
VQREERKLAGGLVLREATSDDIEGILAVQVAAFGPTDEPGIRTYLAGAHGDPSEWSVVVDGDRVVASCALFPKRLVLGGVELAAGEVEFVATDEAYRRQGLVRAQFDWHHERSAELGHVAQFVGGIPYFYRKLGYGYGVSYADLFVFDRATLDPPTDVTFRPAAPGDVAALAALEGFRAACGLRFVRTERFWTQWIEMATAAGVLDGRQVGVDRFWVAERAGEVVGWSAHTLEPDTRRFLLHPAVTTDASVADAVIAHALDEAGDDYLMIGHDTPATEYGRRVRALGRPFPYGLGIYVRIPDPVGFLRAIQPALTQRLSTSPFAGATGRVEISLYNEGVAIEYEAGAVTNIDAIAGLEDPFDQDECGVAPDWFPALALGRFGARELDRRIDDVSLGKHADLLEVLFPRIESDIVGDF